jgi:hypothetical protein
MNKEKSTEMTNHNFIITSKQKYQFLPLLIPLSSIEHILSEKGNNIG